jgi:hypothetical protein
MATETRKHGIYVTLFGERYELLLPGQGWSYTEAKLAKAVSDGMAPGQIGQAFLDSDPDATMAIIRVTLHRAGRKLTPAEVAELAELNLEDIGQAIVDALNAAGEEDPTSPASAGESGPSTSSGNGSPETPSESSVGNGISGDPVAALTAVTASDGTGHPSSPTS